jgi:hypothetical protein
LIKRAGRTGAFAIGVVLGAVIWAMSPIVAGTNEPWDSSSPFYVGALFFSGVIASVLCHRKFVFAVMGIYFGQVSYSLLVGLGPLWLVGMVLLVPYSLIAGLGGLISYALIERHVPKGD